MEEIDLNEAEEEALEAAWESLRDNPQGRSVVPNSHAGDNPGPHVKPISTEEFDPRDPFFDPHKGQVLP